MRFSVWFERFLIVFGCGCLIAVSVDLVRASSFQYSATRSFEHELLTSAPHATLQDGPIGRLEIPRLHLSVMIAEGDDEATLAQAAGHLPGTALPWDQGNGVIAGHRDTCFRPLRNVRIGDEIRIATVRGTFDYRVMSLEIVQPDDLSVIAPTSTRSLTLVTCYPFNYVGPAPRRFIVRAWLQNEDAAGHR
jgi:sortase A